jgi:hypothetical protein
MQLPNPPSRTASAIIFTTIIVMISAGIWALVLRQESQPKAQLAALSGTPLPSPIAVSSPVPHQINAESSPFPSVLPSPTPRISSSPSATASATPTPTANPTPAASPSPSPSPSDIDINLEEVVMAKDGTVINKSETQTAGANYTLKSVTIRNNGHQPATSVQIKLYVQNELKKTDTVGSVAAGTSTTQTWDYTLPNTTGTYPIKVTVNADRTFSETRYDNNDHSFNYTLN